MSVPTALTARFRGAVVGSVCAGAAITAHWAGGGDLPSTAPLVVLACFGTAVGIVVAGSPTGLPRLFGHLWLGQLLGHLILGVGSGHGVGMSPGMFAGHTATALIVGAALCFGERLVVFVASSVRRWSTLPPGCAADDRHRTFPAPQDAAVVRQFLVGAGAPTRGPPVAAAH